MRLRTLAVTAVDAYGLAGRRWPLRWGASSREATARLPGDELVADPDLVATRAMLRSIRDRAERSYDLADAPEAVRYLEQGHTQGKVVATV